ncbi:helix-turn-helix domain-containing protein [Streptomyces sp. NPDC053792]|uniref:helix-turn-helix domain-containing protein n=1 Tax=Streptomyces sp. NPDC053792 TaxID=3365716 RepID=UPI0037D01C72
MDEDHRAARTELLAGLRLDRVAAGAAATVGELPAYRVLDEGETVRELLVVMETALAALAEGRAPSERERAEFTDFGSRRADQGVPLEPLLEAFRLTSRHAFDALYAAAGRYGESAVALALTRDFWLCCDHVSAAVVDGHRRRETQRLRGGREQRALLLGQLLSGELPPESLPTTTRLLGLHPGEDYLAFHLAPVPTQEVAAVEGMLREQVAALLVEPAGGSFAGLADPEAGRVNAGLAEPEAGRFAGLAESGKLSSLRLPVGLGPALPPARAHESYRRARRAAELAAAFGLRRPVADGELPLHAAVLALPATGEQLVIRCFGHTSGSRRATLVRTLDAYLRADANAEAAAAALYVHPNTLRYRLRTFTRVTGLDLGRAEDTMQVWWALRHLEAAAAGPGGAAGRGGAPG